MGEGRGGNQPEAVALVVNPQAGGGKGARGYAEAAESLHGRGIEMACFETSPEAGADVAAHAALSAGFEEIWVVGGDGTLRPALASIVAADAVLGVIPAGTSNCLAMELGTPPEVRAAVAWLLEQPIGRMDLGRAQARSPVPRTAFSAGAEGSPRHEGQTAHRRGRLCDEGLTQLFSVRVGIGLEALGARITERDKQGPGPLAYVLAGIKALREGQATPVVIRAQGETVYEGRTLTAIVSNVTLHPMLRFLGRGRANPADGMLHITIVEDAPALMHLGDWLMGAAHDEPHLQRIVEHRAPAFEMEAGREVEVHLDGEATARASRLKIECLPGHIKVRGRIGRGTQQEG